MNAETKYAAGYPIKLVRERIGERLGGVGTITYEPVPDGETHTALLRAKLIEEAVEYLLDPTVGELADVLEVVWALSERCHGGTSSVERAAMSKYRERGGFINGVVMVAHHEADGRELLPATAETGLEQPYA